MHNMTLLTIEKVAERRGYLGRLSVSGTQHSTPDSTLEGMELLTEIHGECLSPSHCHQLGKLKLGY